MAMSLMAVELLRTSSDRSDDGGDEADGSRAVVKALRKAKSILQLAGTIGDEVWIHQVFRPDTYMSCAEIASHLKEECGWPRLDSEYLVRQAAEEILQMIHKDIQEQQLRVKQAILHRTGRLIDLDETEISLRLALERTLRGSSLDRLLDSSTAEVITAGVDRIMERVRERLHLNDLLSVQPLPAGGEFFQQFCADVTYEHYVGCIGDPGTISSPLLRGVLQELYERFGQDAAISVSPGEHLDDLKKIDAWLGERLNLRPEGESALAGTIKAIEDSLDGHKKRRNAGSLPASALQKDLECLSGTWAMLCIREWIENEGLTALTKDLEILLSEQAGMKRPEDGDSDELFRFIDFPVCANAVLSWLRGSYVSPRAGDYHPAYGGDEDRPRFAPELLLRRRTTEFQSWLADLDYCMDGAHVSEAPGPAVREQLRKLDALLQGQKVEAVTGAEILRESYRKRASETLAGVCSAKLSNYTVNPHKLFKYAVDRGKNSVGRKNDQPLSAKESMLKNNCVVSLA